MTRRDRIAARDRPQLRRCVRPPLVIGVLADLTGKRAKWPLKRFRDRMFIDVDRDTYSRLLRSIGPGLSLVVRNCIGGAEQISVVPAALPVSLRFQSLKVTPEGIVRQMEPLESLLRERRRIALTIANDETSKAGGIGSCSPEAR